MIRICYIYWWSLLTTHETKLMYSRVSILCQRFSLSFLEVPWYGNYLVYGQGVSLSRSHLNGLWSSQVTVSPSLLLLSFLLLRLLTALCLVNFIFIFKEPGNIFIHLSACTRDFNSFIYFFFNFNYDFP